MINFIFFSFTLICTIRQIRSDCFEGTTVTQKIKDAYNCIESEVKTPQTTTFVIEGKTSKIQYILKRSEKNELSNHEVEFLQILSKDNCPYVTKLIDSDTDNQFNYLIMEKYDEGNLFDLALKMAKEKIPVNWKELYGLVYKIALGLKCIHKNGILNMDIKLENIVMKGGDPYIIDSGHSLFKKQAKGIRKRRGTVCYKSPTYYINPPPFSFDDSDDLFSLGVSIYILVYKAYPFACDTKSEYESEILKQFYPIYGPIEATYKEMIVYAMGSLRRKYDLLEKDNVLDDFIALAKRGLDKDELKYEMIQKTSVENIFAMPIISNKVII